MKKELTAEMQNVIKGHIIQQITDTDINQFTTLVDEDTIRLHIIVRQDLSIRDLEAFLGINGEQQ